MGKVGMTDEVAARNLRSKKEQEINEKMWNLKSTTKRGRPISRDTKLGRYLSDNGYRASAVAAAAGFAPRHISEYTSGRAIIPHHHLLALCRVLNVVPSDIYEEDWNDDTDSDHESELTDADHTIPGASSAPDIERLKREHQRRLGA